MTNEDRLVLRAAARAALLATCKKTSDQYIMLSGNWQLQTSNSFRRIGIEGRGDGDVLCATTQPSDRHPDLLAPSAVLDYIVAAQPRVVLELLDCLDKIERDTMKLIAEQVTDAIRGQIRIASAQNAGEIGELIKIRDAIDEIITAKKEHQ